MATDVEESDTDENDERSLVPAKRRRTDLVGPCRSCDPSETDREPEQVRVDEAERLAGEKLRFWQNCQVAKGFLDNAVNRIVEDSILNPCRTAGHAASAASQFRGIRTGVDDDMEDTAVSAAISDRGLVRATRFDLIQGTRRSALSPLPMLGSPPLSLLPVVVPTTTAWTEDPTNESDREQDFLERAVAEAIKKKGLSALSVDYG